MKPLFTVVVIARNESKTLPRLVASLDEFKQRGGEIIVVDTGSTDGTPEIARKLDCTVYEEGDRFRVVIDEDLSQKINERFEANIVKPNESLFDYSAARNYAASKAKTMMICMPDCDEVFTSYNLDEIDKAIGIEQEYGVPKIDQLEYNFVFSHDQYGNEAIKFLHSKFYNREKMQWTGIVHEVLQDLPQCTGNYKGYCGTKDCKGKKHGEVKRQWLPESIIKLEHFQNIETNRGGYLTGLALDCYLNPGKDRQSHYFARELLWKGFPLAAIKEFERHIAMDKWLPEKAQSQIYIGDAYMAMGKETEGLNAWKKAFIMDSSRREAVMRIAEFYYRKNDPAVTAMFAAVALTIPNGNFYADNQEHYTNKPHELLYWALWYLGDKKGSEEHFYKALAYQPGNQKYQSDMRFYLPTVSIILPTLGREESLKRALASIEKLKYPKELIQTIVLDGEGTVPEKVAKGLEQAQGKYIVYAANDIEFTPESLTHAILDSLGSDKALVAFDEAPILEDEGNICTHFLIRKDFIPQIGGQIFDTRYFHVGVDNLLWAKCKKLNQAMHSFAAKIIHHHFSTGKSEFDEVYAKGWDEGRVKHDRDLLKHDLELLHA